MAFMERSLPGGSVIAVVLCSIIPWLVLFNASECKAVSRGVVPSDTYHGLVDIEKRRVLEPDPGVNLSLEWNVRRNSGTIQFRIYFSSFFVSHIVLGFTRKGVVDGGDFVAVGVDYSGRPYVYDMHGFGNTTLIQDAQQDWEMVHVDRSYNGDRQADTIITISRAIDTCDKEDMILNEDLTHVVWDYGYGQSSLLESTYFLQIAPKGILPIYLLDPEIPPLSLSNDPGSLRKWTLARTIQLPERHTSYWCSIHRGPRLSKKHHIVGFSQHFRDEESESYVHHETIFRCLPPPGVDPASVFERFVDHPGHECYFGNEPELPVHLCRQIVHLWGVAGVDKQLPEDVGFPMGENEYEYYMQETHYNNPDVRADVTVENGVSFIYTPHLRANDGGMIFIGYGVISDPTSGGVYVVPPETSEFTIAGQCSPHCTTEMLPGTGVEAFAVTLHAHISAQKMRLRHFRNGRELPLIQREERFDFNFQQMRLLPVPVTILPGDHLVSECVYATSWKNGSTVSGFSTKDEMCNAFVYLNKRLPYMHCSSEYPSRKITSMLGILNTTWELSSYERVVTSAVSPTLVGLKLSEVVDGLHWTSSRKTDLERDMLTSEHSASCPTITTLAQTSGLTSATVPSNGNAFHPRPYPKYQPSTSCPTQLHLQGRLFP